MVIVLQTDPCCLSAQPFQRLSLCSVVMIQGALTAVSLLSDSHMEDERASTKTNLLYNTLPTRPICAKVHTSTHIWAHTQNHTLKFNEHPIHSSKDKKVPGLPTWSSSAFTSGSSDTGKTFLCQGRQQPSSHTGAFGSHTGAFGLSLPLTLRVGACNSHS